MMNFKFSARSKRKLEGVHKDLIAVANRALQLSDVDFGVSEGMRTKERQEKLVKSGVSWTMNSRHLTGHAIDVYAWVDEVRWDWPLYHKIARAMKQASKELKVNIEWGGDWKRADGPHFQLSRRDYK